MMKRLFKNARVIDCFTDAVMDVLVEDGKITELGENIKAEDTQITDLDGLVLMPAFIDLHAHFRDPGLTYKETIETGMKASTKGGYTVVCTMANTKPVCDNVEVLEYVKSKAEKTGLNHVLQISAMGKDLKDEELVDVDANMKYTKVFSNDGNTIFSDDFMMKALRLSTDKGFYLHTHCQPEEEIIERDMKLLEKVGGNLHVCHISTKKSLELIKEARKKGLKVTCEVCPHHVFADSLEYKVNPPFATPEDRKALIEGIREGHIDALATDHAPHSEEDKKNGAPGLDNIEVSFSMFYKVFHDNGISLSRMSEMNSYFPAKHLGLEKGLVKEGYDADFAVVDINHEGKIDKNTFVSKSNNTPFDGWDIMGKVVMTVIGGQTKYEAD